ncbi:FadR family transcriptional regulator [Ramlibacter ginsenosidimutans]|uniref:FadR family transcriptional regulator n=1 Tax=Ramlibacter ginsenosidimutans TaxID=502333 RepID=A0A934TXX0_9BURK|nr:FadR/GntR family transcriptional regulator [Ramlibacter ginsenosidimutans]MBK6009226.1 FadR family transcriptional regulator [Ramlibacter ginsenosidimutans]
MSSKEATEPLLQAEATGPLSGQIYARVVEAILRGDFGAQGKLPTESALAASYGVSRPTIREALSRLRSDGVIDSRRGAGSFVVRMPAAPVASLTPIRSLADVERYYAFRSCVEAGAAAEAAEFRNADDLQALQAAYDALNAAEERAGSAVEADVQFHLAIARCSHNPFFVATIETTVAPIRQFMELAHNAGDSRGPDRVHVTRMEHQAVVDAIVRRAPADAAEAIRTHILNAKQRIFEATRLA